MISLSYFVLASENGLEQDKIIQRGHLFFIFLLWVLPRDNNWGPEKSKEPLTVTLPSRYYVSSTAQTDGINQQQGHCHPPSWSTQFSCEFSSLWALWEPNCILTLFKWCFFRSCYNLSFTWEQLYFHNHLEEREREKNDTTLTRPYL